MKISDEYVNMMRLVSIVHICIYMCSPDAYYFFSLACVQKLKMNSKITLNLKCFNAFIAEKGIVNSPWSSCHTIKKKLQKLINILNLSFLAIMKYTLVHS